MAASQHLLIFVLMVKGSFSDWLLYHVVPSLSQLYGAKGVHQWLAKAQ